jgi:hypothetical protein
MGMYVVATQLPSYIGFGLDGDLKASAEDAVKQKEGKCITCFYWIGLPGGGGRCRKHMSLRLDTDGCEQYKNRYIEEKPQP